MRYESQERVVIGSEWQWKGSICIAVVPIKIIIKTHWKINHKQIYWPSYRVITLTRRTRRTASTQLSHYPAIQWSIITRIISQFPTEALLLLLPWSLFRSALEIISRHIPGLWLCPSWSPAKARRRTLNGAFILPPPPIDTLDSRKTHSEPLSSSLGCRAIN